MGVRGFRTLLPGAVAAAVALLTASAVHATAPALPGIVTQTVVSPDSDVPIPDNGSVVSVLSLTGGGTVVDVDVTLDITHTSAQDLEIYLVSPGGRTVTLTSDNGGDFDDVFAGTTFDDQAPGTPSAANVRNFVFTDLTPTGPVQPEEALGALVGQAAAGPWALVVVDDAGGNTGTLRSWALTVSTLGGVSPGTPMVFDGESNVNITSAAGAVSTATVSGVPGRIHDLDVTVSISHTTAGDLDLFLTSPSGRRIDLVTDVGGGNADLFKGTTFDDQAGIPVGDAELPPDGEAFTAVVPEGALSAFMGEDPNGQWTLRATRSRSRRRNPPTATSAAARAASRPVPGRARRQGRVHGEGEAHHLERPRRRRDEPAAPGRRPVLRVAALGVRDRLEAAPLPVATAPRARRRERRARS